MENMIDNSGIIVGKHKIYFCFNDKLGKHSNSHIMCHKKKTLKQLIKDPGDETPSFPIDLCWKEVILLNSRCKSEEAHRTCPCPRYALAASELVLINK